MVYVDSAFLPFGRMIMCHMTADTEQELHLMAGDIGIQRKWFQDNGRHPHYDICKAKRELAVSRGATEIAGREMPSKAKAMVRV